MSDLREKIAEYDAAKARRVPTEVLETMAGATAQLATMGVADRSLRTGDRVPDFELPNHNGQLRRLSRLLRRRCRGVEFLPRRLVPLLQYGTERAAAGAARDPGCRCHAGRRVARTAGPGQ